LVGDVLLKQTCFIKSHWYLVLITGACGGGDYPHHTFSRNTLIHSTAATQRVRWSKAARQVK
jgi:hypothetical protein